MDLTEIIFGIWNRMFVGKHLLIRWV